MKKDARLRPVTDRFGLPAQVLPSEPKITISGGSEVLIENHGGLLSYSREGIEVRTRSGTLRIRGDELELAAMTAGDIIIRGLIVSLEFC